ncbi:2-oxoglutarate dehydrogenase E2 component (dihydrolipoamide succinyltransferase) [Lewinella marina]|uniref:Dihydrolipoyllysine-residue succinyltransferase component of 2-oxoglutarate dehydrogenase complex n=1 Tax=Neolewinella marina TaxID=438751 RepID=A0A2G0CDX3_9BACT|nr:2-oxoglutarate dehydrogenase complex dihydrolipoyllysine-residue succinyltransferase [Neolewinella marina]NJB85903.1 2-oxoglutarate dehydrogenase E2 component (dihydrolipoamide succinyltransferase) [Neolewinella marina]PHK98120.1 dihydrolipoyllysine-residue succinyltransferase [Neolewinella marina]
MSIVEMKVPVIGESVTEVTLSEWLKGDGDFVELDEPICEFESDKATLEFPAEASGKLIYVAAEGDDLKIGALVAKIDTSVSEESDDDAPAAPAPAAQPQEQPQQQASASPEKQATYASGTPSPAAAKILREKDIDPTAINGSGRDGRITKEDAQSATKPAAAPPAAATKVTDTSKKTAAPSTGQESFSRSTRTEKMSRMRRTIASRLVSAKNETAMLTTFNEVDLSEVMELRKKVQDKFVAKYGVKLGFMSIFAKACAQVLMEMPDVNAHISDDEKELTYHDFVDISFAVSTPTGLVVPPIHNIESLHFADIEKKLKELAAKARDNKLSIEEMTGGTFTITNGGVFGSMMSTPIINKPQSAILGMHNIIERPIAVNGQVVIRPMMYIALSYDHRVIDGSSSVTFLVKVKELLEDPTLLLMGL